LGKEKSTLNDGITNVKVVQHLQNQAPPSTYTTNLNIPKGQPKQNKPQRQFTPLGEPIEDILDRCLKNGLITLPPIKPHQENELKAMWYNENDYCDYHCIVGHKTSDCMKLKHCVQDLIDQKKVNLKKTTQPSPNVNLGAYKDPLPNHNKTSSSNQAYNITPPLASYDSVVGQTEPSSDYINTITIWAQAPDCAVTTHQGYVSIRIAPTIDQAPPSTSNPQPNCPYVRPSPANKYNLLDHLGKTLV